MARVVRDERLAGADCGFTVVVVAVARDTGRVNSFRDGIIDRELDAAKWGCLDTDPYRVRARLQLRDPGGDDHFLAQRELQLRATVDLLRRNHLLVAEIQGQVVIGYFLAVDTNAMETGQLGIA